MAKNSKNNNGWLICEQCHGTGYLNNRQCSACQGQGIGWFGTGHWFFAAWSSSWLTVAQQQLGRKILLIIDLLLYLATISGWLVLVWYLGQVSDWFVNWSDVSQLAWWLAPVWPLRWFGWSLLFGLVVIYRLIKSSRSIKLPRLDIDNQLLPPLDWPAVFSLPKKQLINLIDYLPAEVLFSLEQALLVASQQGSTQVTAEQWFKALLNSASVKSLLFRLNLNGADIAHKLIKQQVNSKRNNKIIGLAAEVRSAIIQGTASAWSLAETPLAVDFLAPLIKQSQLIKEIIYDTGSKENQFADVANWFHINRRLAKVYLKIRDLAQFKPASNMDRAYTAVATPFLNQYAYDLTLAAKNNQLPLCVARETELGQILDAWSAGRLGVVLVGPLGVGKKSLAYGLAQLMVAENVPSFLQDKRLIEIDIASLLGGASPEEAQDKLSRIIMEVNQTGNIILFINGVEKIAGLTSGGEQSLDLSDILANALQRGAVRCLTTTDQDNYNEHIVKRSLGANLAKVDINEPDKQQMMIIAESWASYWERRLGVIFTYAALETAQLVSQRYAVEPAQPARCLNVLEASARQAAQQVSPRLVSDEVVREYASEAFGVPLQRVSQQESELLLNLEETIHQRLIGQEEAVDMVAASLRRARVELRDTGKPIASFLFLGPTGVGKTELAKTLAEVYFGNETAMIRLDMSEYQHPDSVNKMIGGNGETGYLTEAVRQLPFCLILLDELEKAHANILNLFLQVFEDGRLTDNQGRTIDFSNTIIIATSNAGAMYIREQVMVGTDLGTIRQWVTDNELVKVMRPELINRFDGVIVFRPLNLEDMQAITKLQLNKMGRQLADKNINFQVSDQGLVYLAQAGFDPEYGARPLKRLLQDTISNTLAEKLLAKELKRRDTVVINELGEVEIIPAVAL
jgi:ATP-dependent Clp protease ATP-binding subunit ClpC